MAVVYLYRMKSTMMIAGSLRFSFLFALVTGYQASISSNNDKLRTVFEWKDLEYGFPTEADRQQALNNQLYVPHNGVPIDVDVHYKGELFSLYEMLLFTIQLSFDFR